MRMSLLADSVLSSHSRLSDPTATRMGHSARGSANVRGALPEACLGSVERGGWRCFQSACSHAWGGPICELGYFRHVALVVALATLAIRVSRQLPTSQSSPDPCSSLLELECRDHGGGSGRGSQHVL